MIKSHSAFSSGFSELICSSDNEASNYITIFNTLNYHVYKTMRYGTIKPGKIKGDKQNDLKLLYGKLLNQVICALIL